MNKQFFYKLIERLGGHISTFIINLVLARLIMPEEYGIMSVLNAFIAISQILLQGGLNTALIQKSSADEDDYFSITLISLSFSALLVIIIIAIAPIVGNLYGDMSLVAPMRTMAFVLLIHALTSVYNARVVSNMKFKELMRATLLACVISGVICIGLAYLGMGIWALVLQQMLNALLLTLLLMLQTKWFPKGRFVKQKAKSLFSFGWKIMLTNLITRGYVELTALVIGKVFSPSTLAYYNRGKQFPQVVSDNIDGALQGVSLLIFSKESSRDGIVTILRKFMRISTFFLYPTLVLLAILSKNVVTILLTEKWLPAVPFFIVWCFYYMLVSHTTLCNQAIIGAGESGVALKRQITCTIFNCIFMIGSIIIFHDAFIMLVSMLIGRIGVMLITVKMTSDTFDYPARLQLGDLAINIPATFIGAVLTLLVGKMFSNIFIQSILQGITMLVVYLLVSYFLNKTTLNKALEIILSILKKEKKVSN